ncbi:MAG TPA: SET domain-containing protein [Rhodothermales bacterium]
MRTITLNPTPTSHLSPKLESRQVSFGRGIFARQPIRAGEVLSVWGGAVTTGDRFRALPAEIRQISVQVEEDLYLVPGVEGPAEWFNHSCSPNAGMEGQISLVALRDIEAGEEICYDYAMSDGSPYDEFECHCHVPECRGRVTGNDWQRPELWARYGRHFSPYLQRRIDALRDTPVIWVPSAGDGV